MFADKKVNAYITIAAWKQAGLRLPAEDTPEFYPYGDSPSVTQKQPKADDKMEEMKLPPPPPPVPQQAELHTIKVGGTTIALPAPDNGCQRCDHLGKQPLVPFTFRQRLLAFFVAGDATPTQARYFYVQCVRFGAGINETRETYAKLQAAIVRRDQTKGSIFDVTEGSLCFWKFYAPMNMIFTSCMMLVAGRVLHLYGMCHSELTSTERAQMVMKSWRDRIIKANNEYADLVPQQTQDAAREEQPKQKALNVVNATQLVALLGKHVAGAEAHNILVAWPDLHPEQDSYLSSEKGGLSIKHNPDGLVTDVFLMSGGKDGYTQFRGALLPGLSFSSSPNDVRAALGEPSCSGDPGVVAGILSYGAWMRYDYPTYSLHVEFRSDSGSGVNQITLISPLSLASGGDYAFRTGKQIWNDIIRTGGSPEFRETKKKEALRYFDQAISNGYETSEVFSLRGSCLKDLGFYFDALEDHNTAIQKQPSQAIANNYFMRSMIKELLFDFEGSVADLKEAIRLSKLDNDDNRFWNNQAKSIGFDSQTAFYEFGFPTEEMILFKKRTYTNEKIADELKKIKRR